MGSSLLRLGRINFVRGSEAGAEGGSDVDDGPVSIDVGSVDICSVSHIP